MVHLKTQWEEERKEILDLKQTKQEIEKARVDIERAERDVQLGRGRRTQIRQAPEPWKRNSANSTKKVQSRKARMLKEEVGPEEIAEVVAKWTGLPFSKMMESETTKLLQMEEI